MTVSTNELILRPLHVCFFFALFSSRRSTFFFNQIFEWEFTNLFYLRQISFVHVLSYLILFSSFYSICVTMSAPSFSLSSCSNGRMKTFVFFSLCVSAEGSNEPVNRYRLRGQVHALHNQIMYVSNSIMMIQFN